MERQQLHQLASSSHLPPTRLLSQPIKHPLPLLQTIPQSATRIVDVYQGKESKIPPLLIIQDVHMNTEAQTNIASLLIQLLLKDQIGLIGVEGAFGAYNFKDFWEYPNRERIKRVSKAFFDKKKIAAPSFVGLTHPSERVVFWGVDDPDHYRKNVDAYLKSRPYQKDLKELLKKRKRSLLERKKRLFSPVLFEFDQTRQKYHEKEIPFGVYVQTLAQRTPDLDLIVEQFIEALELESTLNFKQVELERNQTMAFLSTKLKQQEMSTLLTLSVAFKAGRLSNSDYYNHIKNVCEKKGFSLRLKPELDRYVHYILLSEQIKADILFKHVHQLEERVYHSLAKTNVEKNLIAESQYLRLVEKLLDFELTPVEWEKYKASRKSKIINLKFFEDFYEQADIRSSKMLENILAQPASKSKVLITGGFHAPMLTQELKKRNLPYILLSPKITKVETDKGSVYLNIFAQQKSPLDKLFKGKKLFLSPAHQAAGNSGNPWADPTTQALRKNLGLGVARNAPPPLATWSLWKRIGIPEETMVLFAPVAESVITLGFYAILAHFFNSPYSSFLNTLIAQSLFTVLHWDGVYLPQPTGPPLFKPFHNKKERFSAWTKIFILGLFFHLPFFIINASVPYLNLSLVFVLGATAFAWSTLAHLIYVLILNQGHLSRWPVLWVPLESTLKHKLMVLASDPSTNLTKPKVEEILKKVKSNELRIHGEDLDIIRIGPTGKEISIGGIDANIAHRYKLLHHSANVFVITPEGNLILQQRVHNKVKPLMLTLFGGHAKFGHSNEETMREELLEEAGFPKNWELKGQFKLVGKEGALVSDSNNPPNYERVSNYIYFATPEDVEEIRKEANRLESKRRNLSQQQYENWLESEQKKEKGRGETWAIHEFDLDVLAQMAREKTDSEYKLTDDVLEPLLLDSDVQALLQKAVAAAKINRQEILPRMKAARRQLAHGNIGQARERNEALVQDLEVLLSLGSEPDDPLIRYYYQSKVMKKFLRWFKGDSEEPSKVNSLQILILDHNRERVLLQKRGPYKRLFAGTYTVSANAKPSNGESSETAAVKAIKEEVGLEPDPSRVATVKGAQNITSQLISYEFYAYDEAEEERLKTVLRERGPQDRNEIYLRYNSEKRSLTLFTLNPNIDRNQLKITAEAIATQTGIPYLYPAYTRDEGSLLTYQLTKEEGEQIQKTAEQKRTLKEKALSSLRTHATEQSLKTIDSDDMEFLHWRKINNDFSTRPLNYALDLTGRYFGDEEVWEGLFPSVVNVDDARAALVPISGGKGSNTHILRKLGRQKTIPQLNVPETSVLTTYAYERVVLGNSHIQRLITQLDASDERPESETEKIAEEIRKAILTIDLPEDLKRKIIQEFHRLGEDIAVRSSATVEDLKEHAAAGQADSSLHVITEEQVIENVKRVWASLFNMGFVNNRKEAGFSHKEAKMAVLLQKQIIPKAAGTTFTIHGSERPIYMVQAQPGLGEGAVQGKGQVDEWLVGFMADSILESNITQKTYRVAPQADGGITEEKIRTTDPSLTDSEVLEIARLVKLIHRYYKKEGLAENVDVEFVVDEKGEAHIVQTRSKSSWAIHQEGKGALFHINVVDEAKVPPHTTMIQLSQNSSIATYGAVTAELQVLKSGRSPKDRQSDSHIAARTRPGVVLVAHHTNNEFNQVFSKLAGVITTDGGTTSHAAQNSADHKIPCVVGAVDAFEKLAPYDGQLVTFDSDKRRIYIGAVPIVKETRRLDIWTPNEGEQESAAVEEIEPHEIFQRWKKTRARRPEVYRDFSEDGHLRRRSGIYRQFELDYYYKAWDRLTDYLNRKYKDRRPWVLETQDRIVKNEPGFEKRHPDSLPRNSVRGGLHHRIVQDDPKSIYYFIKGLKDLTEDDLLELFEDRWRGFKTFAEFMNSIEKIDPENVESVVDHLIDIFVWMHFAFWLDVTVNHIFAFDQLRYVDPVYATLLKEEAIRDLPTAESVDPKRPDVPPGTILKLSRRKDIEFYSTLERIWSQPGAAHIFLRPNIADIWNELKDAFPDISRIIDSWSLRFKETSEDLEELSDTEAYLADVKDRVLEGRSVSLEFINEQILKYYDPESPDRLDLEKINKEDSDLYLVIRGYARVEAARKNTPGWATLTEENRLKILINMTTDDLEKSLSDVMGEIERLIKVEQEKRKAAQRALEEFPRLRKNMALAHQEFFLREDGHHLIVPHQRKIARMMLNVGEKHKAILETADEIFDISTDELIALFKEPDPSFVKESFRRTVLLRQIEDELSKKWKISPAAAVKEYEKRIEEILQILESQVARATLKRVQDGYRNEAARLKERVHWLQDSVRMLKLKELLNKREATRKSLNAHVLLVLGTDNLDNFAEAVELYAAKKVQKILISGGLGRGTLSLIEAALKERIPIRISDMEIISHVNHIARLKELEKREKLEEALQRSEADIIKQIILHMGKNRKDDQENDRPIVIKEEDILLEHKTKNIWEYFENSRPILLEIKENLGLGAQDALTIAYIHDPIVQFGTKALFETLYEEEVKDGVFRGISYTREHDIYALGREITQQAMLREMFGLILFSEAGHVVPQYGAKKGLSVIPWHYWQAAAELVESFSNKKELQDSFGDMIRDFQRVDPDYTFNITELTRKLPPNVLPMSKAIQNLFAEDNPPMAATWPLWVKLGIKPQTAIKWAPVLEGFVTLAFFSAVAFPLLGFGVDFWKASVIAGLLSDVFFTIMHWQGIYELHETGPPTPRIFQSWQERFMAWRPLFLSGLLFFLPLFVSFGLFPYLTSNEFVAFTTFSFLWSIVHHKNEMPVSTTPHLFSFSISEMAVLLKSINEGRIKEALEHLTLTGSRRVVSLGSPSFGGPEMIQNWSEAIKDPNFVEALRQEMGNDFKVNEAHAALLISILTLLGLGLKDIKTDSRFDDQSTVHFVFGSEKPMKEVVLAMMKTSPRLDKTYKILAPLTFYQHYQQIAGQLEGVRMQVQPLPSNIISTGISLSLIELNNTLKLGLENGVLVVPKSIAIDADLTPQGLKIVRFEELISEFMPILSRLNIRKVLSLVRSLKSAA